LFCTLAVFVLPCMGPGAQFDVITPVGVALICGATLLGAPSPVCGIAAAVEDGDTEFRYWSMLPVNHVLMELLLSFVAGGVSSVDVFLLIFF
jgi:hypothetical protein